MFRTTTHYKYWIFDDEDELYRRRQEANHRFIRNNITLINVKVRFSSIFCFEDLNLLLFFNSQMKYRNIS